MARKKPYSVGVWGGMDNYECAFCPFATLRRKSMMEHLRTRHVKEMGEEDEPEPEPKPVRKEKAAAKPISGKGKAGKGKDKKEVEKDGKDTTGGS